MTDRVRYGENNPNEDEHTFYIYSKGMNLGSFPQLKLKKIIEKALDEPKSESIWQKIKNIFH